MGHMKKMHWMPLALLMPLAVATLKPAAGQDTRIEDVVAGRTMPLTITVKDLTPATGG
jgi:hypothetical protein